MTTNERTRDCTVTTVDRGDIRIHVFTSPVEGEIVNSLVVETRKALLVIDTPLLRPYAEEYRTYIESLGKPVEKFLVTHAHPDHWFGVSLFPEHETLAFAEAIDEMRVLKDLAIGYHTSLHAELMPAEVHLPTGVVDEGPIEIDGTVFNLQKVMYAEASCTMVVEIPSINTLLPQDLVANNCHLYLATRTPEGEPTLDTWISHLRGFDAKRYETVIPGHGRPGDGSLFQRTIDYLKSAREVMRTATDSETFVNELKSAYPGCQLDLTLEMTAFMLYPADAAH